MATLKATKRDDYGTRPARKLRTRGKIPAVMYGHGQETVSLTLEAHDVEVALIHGERLLEIDFEGKTENALISEVQYDAFGNDVLHVDLTRVNLDERVEVTVPVQLIGTPEGIKDGGTLQQPLMELNIEIAVRNIPETIEHVVTEMQMEDRLYVRDLELPEGTKLVDEEQIDAMVASVTEIIEEEQAPAEESAEAAEPEVIGAKPEDEGAEEASE
jgi:large subunit ribosomal protein L25